MNQRNRRKQHRNAASKVFRKRRFFFLVLRRAGRRALTGGGRGEPHCARGLRAWGKRRCAMVRWGEGVDMGRKGEGGTRGRGLREEESAAGARLRSRAPAAFGDAWEVGKGARARARARAARQARGARTPRGRFEELCVRVWLACALEQSLGRARARAQGGPAGSAHARDTFFRGRGRREGMGALISSGRLEGACAVQQSAPGSKSERPAARRGLTCTRADRWRGGSASRCRASVCMALCCVAAVEQAQPRAPLPCANS